MIEAFEHVRLELTTVLEALPASALDQLAEAAERAAESLTAGGGVYFIGNGGSAAQAEHFAAELVGCFRRQRPPMRSAALSSSGPLLSAVANDFSADDLFVRQVQATVAPGDILVALSTSGTSANVLRGLDEAGRLGGLRLGLTGSNGGEMSNRCEWLVSVPSTSVERIQEAHLLLGHLFCGAIEDRLHGGAPPLAKGKR